MAERIPSLFLFYFFISCFFCNEGVGGSLFLHVVVRLVLKKGKNSVLVVVDADEKMVARKDGKELKTGTFLSRPVRRDARHIACAPRAAGFRGRVFSQLMDCRDSYLSLGVVVAIAEKTARDKRE